MAISNSIAQLDTVITTELPAIREALTSMLNNGGTPEIGRGTAFPSGPATYDLFFREDLGLLCYFDGTNWLTVNKYAVNPSIIYNLPATDAGTFAVFLCPTPNIFKITNIIYVTHVATTSNASNYYTVGFTLANFTVLNSVNTSLDANNTWVRKNNTVDMTIAPTTNYLLRVTGKVGSPGAIYASAMLYGHEVVT